MAEINPPDDPLFGVRGQRVLITGASRGIGRHLALGFAARGAHVALLARGAEALAALAREVAAKGVPELVLPCDVGDAAAVARAFDRVREAWGGLDVLIHNAGINIRKPALELETDEWHAVLRTNLDSTFHCCRAAGALLGQGSRVVLMGSVAGVVALPTGVAYAASKAAIAQMARTLALEWGPRGIRVNCIAPWYFRTPLTEPLLSQPAFVRDILRVTPLGRIGDLDELLGAALFLASRASGYVTGHTLVVDGGMTIHGFTREQ